MMFHVTCHVSMITSNVMKFRDVRFFSKITKMSKAAQASNAPPLSEPNRPYTLPPGSYRPKQSLGQNFLSDQHYVTKIVNAFHDDVVDSKRVIEIGSGAGALTRVLYPKYPEMTAIEIDERGIKFLKKKLPGLNFIHDDVLNTKWPVLAEERGGRLDVIGNLPYNVTSQILFNMADNYKCIRKVVITSQWEFGTRVVAKPNTKAYGIPSVVFQLYSTPKLNFKIPPSVFYPVPKVDSSLLTLDFSKPLHPTKVYAIKPALLRKVLAASFGKRRKMLRHSLKPLLQEIDMKRAANPDGKEVQEEEDGRSLSSRFDTKRPEQLHPLEFLDLTVEVYGDDAFQKDMNGASEDMSRVTCESDHTVMTDETIQSNYTTAPAWRSSSSKGGRTVNKNTNKR